jgi:hypothetical protein
MATAPPAQAGIDASPESPSPDMDAWLALHFPVRVEMRPGRGRCLIASRALPAGSLVLASTLPAAVCMQPESRCAYCFNAPDGIMQAKLLRCSACKAASYCSNGCQRADWPNHRSECKHLLSWMREIDMPDRVTLLLLGRLIRGKGLREATAAAEGPGAGAGAGAGAGPSFSTSSLPPPTVYTHTLEDVLAMQSDTSGRLDGHFLELITVGRTMSFLPPSVAPGGTGAGAGASSSFPADTSSLLRVLNSFDCNNFGVTDELLSLRASGVSPAGAILNHSCTPTCVLGYVCEEELAREQAGLGYSPSFADLPPPKRAKLILVARTLRPVAEGEELTHSYVEQQLLAPSRRDHLSRTYGFECDCAACLAADTPSHPLDHARFTLAGARAGTGPFRIGIVRAVPSGPRAQEEEDIVSEFDGMDADAVADVKMAQGILMAAQLAMARPEILASMPDLPLQPRPEDATLIPRAQRERGLSPEDTRGFLREIRALEAALRMLRRHLHPFHSQVMQCVLMLHERCMAVTDDRAAAAANEHIVAHHLHVYTLLEGRGVDPSSAPPVHPMLCLQLFTQGDLYTALVDVLERGDAGLRCSEARSDELASLLVEMDAPDGMSGGREADHTGARIRPSTLALLPESDPETPRKWLERAVESYRLASVGLHITHGSAHSLVADVDARLASAQSRLASLSTSGGGRKG